VFLKEKSIILTEDQMVPYTGDAGRIDVCMDGGMDGGMGGWGMEGCMPARTLTAMYESAKAYVRYPDITADFLVHLIRTPFQSATVPSRESSTPIVQCA
jgi:hypothetical protein